MTGQFSGTDAGNANLTITDGTTTGFGINKITVSGGDLTSASNGEAVIDTSGGGGGSVVTSLNTATGAITIAGGTNITVGLVGTTLTVNGDSGTIATGVVNEVAYYTGTDALGGNTGLSFDSTGPTLSIGDTVITGSTGLTTFNNTLADVDFKVATTSKAGALTIDAGANTARFDVPLTLATDLAVADGGTGSSTAAGARTNLGVLPKIADIRDISTSIVLTISDAGKVIFVNNALGGAVNIEVPGLDLTLTDGFQVVVVAYDNSGGAITITPTDGGSINGGTGATVLTPYKAYTLVVYVETDGITPAKWVAIG
jgi:hypothetical protein